MEQLPDPTDERVMGFSEAVDNSTPEERQEWEGISKCNMEAAEELLRNLGRLDQRVAYVRSFTTEHWPDVI